MSRGTTRILSTVATVATVGLSGLAYVFFEFIDGPYILLFVPLFFIFIFTIVIIGVVVHFRERSRRREDMQTVARRLGWNFAGATNLPLLKSFADNLAIFSSHPLKGSTENCIHGLIKERNLAVFDQNYSTGSGKNRNTFTQTMFLIEINEAQFPLFCLEPEGFMSRLFDTISRYDIDFPSHRYFSQKYVLYGQNENHIRWFFTDPILNFYEQNPLFTTVAGGRFLLIYEHDRVLQLNEIMPRIDFLLNLANLLVRR